jgi:parallel beta-helix repeat protein
VVLDHADNCKLTANLFQGAQTAILLNGARSNTIDRNRILHSAASGIELKDGSDGNQLSDNTIDGTGAPETQGGGIFVHGAHNNRVSHNLVRNTAGFGIAISNWDDSTINIGNVVEYNLLQATTLTASDSGAIYVLGRSSVDTQTVIAGNVIDGVGAPGRHNVGIYLDDSTGGAIVTGNLVRRIGSDAVQIHGGSDNIIDSNLLDLSEGGPSAVLFQRAPADTNPTSQQTGNVVERNVIILADENAKLFVSIDGGSPRISGNLYASLSGQVALSPPPVGDLRPALAAPEAAQDASRGDYTAAQVAGAAIGFKPIDISAAGPRTSQSELPWVLKSQ